jgi:heptosyltransferase-2
MFPYSKIDYLTDDSAKELLNSLAIFDSVHSLPDVFPPASRYKLKILNKIKRISRAVKLGFRLRKIKYDIIIDLQNNRLSRVLRKIIFPDSWSEFNCLEPKPAGIRVLETFQHVGFSELELSYDIPYKLASLQKTESILTDNGWDRSKRLIVLNPAGLWKTRNWPIENYVDLGKLYLKEEPSQILLLGTQRMNQIADYVSSQLGENVINLVNKTKIDEVFTILKYVALIISEDSGLMHFGWVSGVPTIALLGSSRSDWTMPLGEHTKCLN